MIDEYFWIAAQLLIAACFGIGTALFVTRSKKEIRQELNSEIKTLEKSLDVMHREAAGLRDETAALKIMKEESAHIRKEYADLADRKLALEEWARTEVRKLDEMEERRRSAKTSQEELSRLEDALGTMRAVKARLEGEIEGAKKKLDEANDAKAALDELISKRLAAEAALDLAKQRLAKFEREIESAESRSEKAKAELERDELDAENAAKRKMQISEELERMRSDREELSRENKELRRRMELAERRKNELEHEEISLKSRRDAFQNEIAQLLETIAPGNSETLPDGGGRLGNLEQAPVLAHPHIRSRDKRMAVDERDKLEQVIAAIKQRGLLFKDRIVHRFHTALKVSRISPLTVLAGISGTGKTQLPREYAKAIGMECLIIPVQPRWDGPRDLLGHFDFLHRRFQATDLARLIYHYTHVERVDEFGKYELMLDDDRMAVVLLDEMNLARTEYYFSEFLSRLELQGQKDENVGDEIDKERMVKLDIPYVEEKDAIRVFPTQRILWVGTMNEDESTMTLSDKVIDRSNILRFSRPANMSSAEANMNEQRTDVESKDYLSANDWNEWSKEERQLGEAPSLIERVNGEVMEPCGRSFGHRMSKAMVQYVRAYTGRGWQEAFGDQIEMRLLPKLQGVDAHMESADDAMGRLARLCEEDLKDEELAASIRKSSAEMQETGTFNWTGRTLS